MLIRDELMNEGSIDEAPVYVREVIRPAFDLKSASIILVHNHPSGDPSPSRADIDLTRAVVEAGRSWASRSTIISSSGRMVSSASRDKV